MSNPAHLRGWGLNETQTGYDIAKAAPSDKVQPALQFLSYLLSSPSLPLRVV
jgi:hypothetical protein